MPAPPHVCNKCSVRPRCPTAETCPWVARCLCHGTECVEVRRLLKWWHGTCVSRPDGFTSASGRPPEWKARASVRQGRQKVSREGNLGGGRAWRPGQKGGGGRKGCGLRHVSSPRQCTRTGTIRSVRHGNARPSELEVHQPVRQVSRSPVVCKTLYVLRCSPDVCRLKLRLYASKVHGDNVQRRCQTQVACETAA